MTLDDYLSKAGRGTSALLARATSVRPVMVSQWRAGKKAVAPRHCMAIEAVTGGAVRRWDLRPADWFQFWPDLVGAKDAPAIPAAGVVPSGARHGGRVQDDVGADGSTRQPG